jgi:flagellar biosynthesis protein FlhG
MKRIDDQNYYEMLEIGRGASTDEIREAYRREKEVFNSKSLAIYSLLATDELERINTSIDEAYRVLTDARLRAEYNRKLDGLKAGISSTEPRGKTAAQEPSPSRGESAGSAFPNGFRFTGSSLRAIRESMGIDLKQIYEKTKINREHLKWLEEGDFTNLPALVYIRGFIVEYAKALNLEPNKVVDSYLESYHQWKKEWRG